MKQTQNLRFLLALGNQKVVVTQDPLHTHIYTNPQNTHPNVSVKRMTALLTK